MRHLSFFALIFILSFSLLPIASATVVTDDYYSPPPPQNQLPPNNLFPTENHSYEVFFRGNGEALVYARFNVVNTTEYPLRSYTFTMPKVVPDEMIMYQQVLPKRCIRYGPVEKVKEGPEDYVGNKLLRPCVAYEQENSNGNTTNAQYKKISYTRTKAAKQLNSTHTYKLSLPEPIQPQQNGVIIVGYNTLGYVKERLGLFRFDFETPKVDKRLQKVQVSVNVDSELFLQGKKSQVNYQTPQMDISEIAGLSSSDMVLDSYQTQKMNSMVQSIGTYGPLIKTAKNLSSNESFSVRGQYSTSKWRFVMGKIISGIIILAAIFLGIPWIRRYRTRKSFIVSPPPQGKSAKSVASTVEITPSLFVSQSLFTSWKVILSKYPNFWLGLLSATLVILLILFVQWADESGWYYKIYEYIGGRNSMEILIVFSLIALFAAAILGPALLSSLKRGWKGFLKVLLFGFISFVLLTILLGVVRAALFSDSNKRPSYSLPYDCYDC
jgi:hypothetical protein